MKKRILIIAQQEENRTELQGILQEHYDVLVATSAAGALEMMKQKDLSLSAVLLDVLMTDTDGYVFLENLRKNPQFSQLPIIVTTKLDSEDARDKAIAYGADDYVTQPYHETILIHSVHNMIKLHETSALVDTLCRDKLTGLLNRESFFAEAERLIHRHEPGFYILSCFDVDHFKVINDQHGTKRGDEVLRHVAGSINEFVAGINGITGRYMADKFAVLYPAALKDSQSLRDNHAKTMSPDCIDRTIRIHIGRFLVRDLSLPVSAMFDRATLAAESIKSRYDVYIADYDDSMRDTLIEEQKIVNMTSDAIRNNEFEAWFQPQYDHATGKIIGAEALARWRSNGALIPPYKFIPIFERNGFVYRLDQYIWRQVCALLRRWLDEGKTPLPISVNISRFDMYQPDFLSTICGLVEEYRLPVQLLRLEVTESAFSESTKTIVRLVNELIAYGFTVEIDDFGSGYSSLNTLKDVPASILKLDMKFFENTENTQRSGSIVESVVRMARWLGMAVIAEGVETLQQADYLKSIGCNYIQGYFYAKPMTRTDYEALCDSAEKEPTLDRLKTVETWDNYAFWNPDSLETLIFNSLVGGACIFELCNGKVELLRYNERYLQVFSNGFSDGFEQNRSPLDYLDAENHARMMENIEKAISTKKEAVCEMRLKKDDSHQLYIRATVRLIAKTIDRFMLYCIVENITEQSEALARQRAAERKELESAAQLKVIMANVNSGVSALLIDDEGKSKMLFTNRKYYEIFGYTKEQALAEKLDVMSLIFPEDFPAVLRGVKKLKKTKKPMIIDYRCNRRDGKVVYVRTNSSVMSMAGYGEEVIVSVVTDITEQKELSEQLKAVIDNINGGVSASYLVDGKPKLLLVNDRFYEILGYEREEYLRDGGDHFSHLHPDDYARVTKEFMSSSCVGKKYTLEYRIIRKDGAIRNIRSNISVIRIFGVDSPIQLAVASDITDVRVAQKHAQETADKFSTVLKHVGSGITAVILRENSSEILFSNDMYYEILGCTRAYYHSHCLGNGFELIHPDDRKRVGDAARSAKKAGESASVEYRIVTPDGVTKWVKTIITVTDMAGIDFPVQLAVFTDVTAEHESEELLRFLNHSSHEILAQPDSSRAIDETLRKLLAYFKSDRVYIVELDKDKDETRYSYEECASGISGEKARFPVNSLAADADLLNLLQGNQSLVIHDESRSAECGETVRQLWAQRQLDSLFLSPLWRSGKLLGYIGIDNPRKSLNHIERLRALSDYCAILLTRRDLDKRLASETDAMRVLMNDTPGGFCRMLMREDLPPKIAEMNDGLATMFGLTKQEALAAYGENVLLCMNPDDIAATLEEARKAMRELGRFTGRCRLLKKSGEYLWTMVFGRFLRADTGEIYLNAFFTDITEQLESENRRKQLLDNLPCGAALYEYDGVRLSVVHINKRYWQLVERTPADYSKESVLDAIYPGDRQTVSQEIAAGIRQGRNVSCEVRIRCGDAGYKPFHIAANVVPMDNGVYAFYTFYMPISDRDMSVQEMLPIVLSAMMSSSNDFSFVKDKDLRYLSASRSIAELLGFSNDREIIGKSDFDLFARELADKYYADDQKLLSTGEAIVNISEKLPSADGVRYVKTSKYPLLDAAGAVIGLYGISQDITEARKNESQLRLLTDSIPGGIASFAFSGESVRVLYYNEGFFRCSGYSRQEYLSITSDDPFALLFPADRLKLESLLTAIRKHECSDVFDNFVYRCRIKDGTIRWLSMMGRVSDRTDDGFVLNVVQLDITERQEAEERLRVSEEESRLAIAHSGNIITKYSVADKTLSLPDTISPIFGLPAILYNMPEEQISLGRVSPETAEAYRVLYREIDGGSKEGTATFQQNSAKGWRWLKAKYTTVFSGDSKPVSAVISYADITEQLEKEVVYNKWQQSLEERDKSSYTLFRCNLSRDSAYDNREGDLIALQTSSEKKTFDEVTEDYAGRFVHPDDRARYLSFLFSDSLLARYYSARRSARIEYRELTENGGVRWLRLTVDLVEFPNSKEIEVYLMFENIDEEKKTELLTLERSERDALTGAYNRSAFVLRLEEILKASKSGEQHALFMLDVDNFKSINDTLGHGVGDKVLRELTESIRAILRRDDMVARVGGDEFFVFLRDIPDESIARRKAKQIGEIQIDTGDASRKVTFSIGVVMIPQDGKEFEALYQKVDEALYEKKNNGKNGFTLYSQSASHSSDFS